MTKISVPLNVDANGVLQYPGVPASWSDTEIIGETVIGTYAGDLYQADGKTPAFNWTAYVPPSPTYGTRITSLAFMSRFTSSEEEAIRTAAQSSVPLQMLLDRISMAVATYIDLSDARLVAGMGQLVAAGLLTQARADDIMQTPAAWSELPPSIQSGAVA